MPSGIVFAKCLRRNSLSGGYRKKLEREIFTNSGSRGDTSPIVRRRAEAEERKDGHLTGHRAASGG